MSLNQRSAASDTALAVAKASTAFLSLSLVIFAYERALSPSYGSGPTSFLLLEFIRGVALLCALNPFTISAGRNLLYSALLLILAPNASYWVPVLTSRRNDPFWGPAFTHLVVLSPLVFFLTNSVLEVRLRRKQAASSFASGRHIAYRVVAVAINEELAIWLSRAVWRRFPYLNTVSDSGIFLSLAAVAFTLWVVELPFAPPAPSKRRKATSFSSLQTKSTLVTAFLAAWWSAYPHICSPVLPHPLLEPFHHPKFPLVIHSSVQSVTGLIVVGEALPPPSYKGGDDTQMHSVRYMRASHSILGGVWMGSKVGVIYDIPAITDSYGTPLGDSIYATFVLQEVARLVNSTAKGKSDEWENVLIIGLGTGISATAFSRHGISTTIVEIDPAVYHAAKQYFGLPDPGPGKVFLEDARGWVARKRANIEAGKPETLFDIVVHDCFSGGGVPEHIFTSEFWEDLKTVLEPEGVLVVNFAGMIKSESSRMISQTLANSFITCRVFHDSGGELHEEKYETEFINIVFFCTSSDKLTFRKPRKADFLGSPLRRHVFSSIPGRELNIEILKGPKNDSYIVTDQHNPLGKLQDASSHHHWKVMREVLPDIFWETY